MSEETSKVAVVIVNFNGGDLTPVCLHSLHRSSLSPWRTIVVDNASSDGSRESLQELAADRFEFIGNDENLGFAKACNQGMRRALAGGADFVFLLNNDARLHPEALGHLLAAAGRWPGSGLLGGKIYFGDGPNLWCAGMDVGFHPNLQRLRGFDQADVGQFDSEEIVDALTGCGLLIRREFLEQVGFFDEDFFVYVEDLELSLRGKRLGWTSLYVPQALLYHDAGSTSGVGYSPWRKYMLAYNLVIFLRKQGSWTLWLSFLLLDVLSWPLVFGLAVLRGRGQGALAKGRGIFHGLLGLQARPSSH